MVQALEVPIFNRVSQISYHYTDLSDVPLRKEDVLPWRTVWFGSSFLIGN